MWSSLHRLLRLPAADAPPVLRWSFVGLLVVYLFGGTLFFNRLQNRSGQPLHELGFGYGVLIQSLERDGTYAVADVHYPGVTFSAHRLPLIPYFLLGAKKVVGDDLARIALVKTAVFGAALLAALLIVWRRTRASGWTVLLTLGLALSMPRWSLNLFELGLEEAYTIPVLALLFSLLWFLVDDQPRGAWWALVLGGTAVLLMFLKNSMLYWALVVPVFAGLSARSWRPAGTTLVIVVLGGLGLASFNYVHAGRFTTGSSWEGWNLFKGNSEHTAGLYPPYSLDILDYEGRVVADRPLADEWDHNAYFRQRAIDFIKAHPAEFLRLACRKAWVFFGEVRPTGLQHRGEPRYGRWQNVLQIPWLIAFRAVLWTAIGTAVIVLMRQPRTSRAWRIALGYLVFLCLYSGFYVIGFAYERHVMPIVLPTLFYLLTRSSDLPPSHREMADTSDVARVVTS